MTIPSSVRAAVALLRRFAWVIAVLGVALLVAWFRVWAPVSVRVARVERGTVIEEAFGRGTVESQREAAVGFDLIGRLSEVLVEEGDRVTLGQELARLETDQAQADFHSAQTGVSAARASLHRLASEEDRARALLATAERESARAQSLFASGALPGLARDEASDRLRLAHVDLDRVLAQRSEATRSIDVASGGAEQRRVAMVRATLLAPFDGLVTRRLREPGDTVTVGATVLRIVDTGSVVVNAAVDETVLSQLAVDQPTTISFPAREGVVDVENGHVSRIAWEADRQTHELLVEVTPEHLERRVAMGLRADVRIAIARRDDVLRIPIDTIHHDESGPFVYVDRAGRIALLRPRFGISGAEFVEVVEGLVEGDLLLSSPAAGVALSLGRRWVEP